MGRLSLLLRPSGLSMDALGSRSRPARIRTDAPLLLRSQPRARPKSTLASNTPKPARRRRLPKLLLAGTLTAALAFYLLYDPRPKTLNPTTFAPYTVASKTPVSPTSFILALRPQHPSSTLPYLTPSGSWWPFQWSVQVKQPEIQIQREYTPLPPSDPDAGDGDGTLRFFVRRVAGGEVSNYLARKDEGDTVEVRLGDRGFAFNYLDAREPSDVICLAGGTGVATAMQVAHAVLRDPSRLHLDTRVRILWAVRRRSDIQALPQGPKLRTLEGELDDPTPIARELLAMKTRYGKSLDIRVAVDEEGTAFNERELRDALDLTGKSRRRTPPRYPVALPPPIATACDENAPSVPETIPPGTAPTSLRRPVFVCGPDGFVDLYAGRLEMGAPGRFWRRGGVLGELNARFGDGETWLVLGFP